MSCYDVTFCRYASSLRTKRYAGLGFFEVYHKTAAISSEDISERVPLKAMVEGQALVSTRQPMSRKSRGVPLVIRGRLCRGFVKCRNLR